MASLHTRACAALAFSVAAIAAVVQPGTPAFPARRLRMLVSVEHKDQLPAYVDKFIEHRGSLNVASAYCYDPGEMPIVIPNETFCDGVFTQPLRAAFNDTIRIEPIIEMASAVAMHNIKSKGYFTSIFTKEAVAKGYDGYLIDAEVSGDRDYKDAEAYKEFLKELGDAMHDVNKTVSVLVTSTHSHFAPLDIIDACGGVDSFVVEEGSESAEEIAAFVKALAYKYPGKGNALLYPHGELNAASEVEQILEAATVSKATEIAFFANFADMGDVWWPPMQRWLEGGDNATAAAPA